MPDSQGIQYFAHSAPRQGGPWEPLAEHLKDVAGTAAGFAAAFGAEEEARAAGLLHDLGKYSDRFTARLEGKAQGLDHWSAGAAAAMLRYGVRPGFAVALAIQGHHIGLQRGSRDAPPGFHLPKLAERHPLNLTLTEVDSTRLLRCLEQDGLVLPATFQSVWRPFPEGVPLDPFRLPDAAALLDVRMLFSTLVDADFLETEAHFERGEDGAKRHRPESPVLAAGKAFGHLEAHLAELGRRSTAHERVASLRQDLLADCLEAAELGPGLFTLTAPTGAGKTLAMLAFALKHAARYGQRRIVVALPFLSILEQTARIYRGLLEPHFDAAYVLEHHSLAGGTGDEPNDDGALPGGRRQRWLTENWDAPLVITTSVQLLESLASHRPRPCRKLHRLAGSVLLFDEVQTLPPALAVPTLATLSHLAARYGSTVVFATATQPAFEALSEKVEPLAGRGWKPHEIVRRAADLFERARRVRVRWEIATPRSWASLAAEMAESRQALAIVNLKRHARALAEALQAIGAPGLLHLSTNLCPAHRETLLAEIYRRLKAKEPCLLVSTQCVEAGVDVDFPKVFRALAPLDAIAQAAGRCNRNGLLAWGEVVVFRPEAGEREILYPPGGYQEGAEATELLLRKHGPEAMNLSSPDLFREYYRALYEVLNVQDPAGRTPAGQLLRAIEARDFVEVAKLYRLIPGDTMRVLVPYREETWRRLRGELAAAERWTPAWSRRAQPHAVSLYRLKKDDPLQNLLEPVPLGRGEVSDEWFVCTDPEAYDRDLFGFVGPAEAWRLWIA